MPGKGKRPAILDKAVSRIKSRGVPTSSAWPIAVSAMQKSGNVKAGTLKATKQGTRRGAMTRAQRQRTPP